MADVWSAEVTVGPLTYTGPTTGLNAFLGPGSLRYSFECQDFGFNDPAVNRPAITLELRGHGDGTWDTVERHGYTFLGAQIASVFGLNQFVSTGVGAFTGGGTLRIIKDETLGTYTFQGILGSTTITFDQLAGLGPGFGNPAEGEIAPDTLAIISQTVQLEPSGLADTTLVASYRDFFGVKNGTRIKGATLASDDRGSWESTADPLTPWLFDRLNANVTITTPDTGSAIAVSIVSDEVSGLFTRGSGARSWDQAVYIDGSDPNPPALDMTTAREHGAIWVALVYPATNTVLVKRSTYDVGATWSETAVVTGGAPISSPSINWHAGKLYIVYQEGAAIKQVRSDTLCADWNTPVTLALTGSNPRHLVDLTHGLSFYFVIAGGDLVLYRSGDFGNSFFGDPITVVAGITTQTVGAEVASDGSILVTYLAASAVNQLRSHDLGVSWS